MLIKNREALYSALSTKIGDRPCPLCGKNAGFHVELPEHQIIGFDRTSKGLDLSPSGFHHYIPSATLICKNCGCIQMLSLQVLLDNPNYPSDSL